MERWNLWSNNKLWLCCNRCVDCRLAIAIIPVKSSSKICKECHCKCGNRRQVTKTSLLWLGRSQSSQSSAWIARLTRRQDMSAVGISVGCWCFQSRNLMIYRENGDTVALSQKCSGGPWWTKFSHARFKLVFWLIFGFSNLYSTLYSAPCCRYLHCNGKLSRHKHRDVVRRNKYPPIPDNRRQGHGSSLVLSLCIHRPQYWTLHQHM